MVFKYRALNKNSIQSLIQRELWFATPASLNDPFECQFDFNGIYKKLDEIDHLSLLEKSNVKSAITKAIEEQGIYSTAMRSDNQIMWAHYGDDHRGFCLGFDENEILSIDKAIKGRAVTYDNELCLKDSFNFLTMENKKLDINVNNETFFSTLNTKSKGWEYEEEFRFVRGAFGAVIYPFNALKSITFGLRMTDRDKTFLKELLSGVEWSHIEWFQIIKAEDKLELTVEKI